MALDTGTHLGPYEIVDVLGAGGMGVVYRARDARLRREVAVKVLPPHFAKDPDRVRRFEQEALAVARLAHPQIVAIYDVGTFEGSPYLVMELLAGETLRDKIAGRPLPMRRAIEYAIEIARGLAGAHDEGIVHRDIKPDNVFITRDGRVKLLDFGIAKLKDPEASLEAEANTQTVHGVVGTPSYMSPEQARGLDADRPSDMFSLGIVLYEMLSGVSPFRRETPAETMTAILHDDPPAIAGPVAGAPAVQRVLRHCLEKDPGDRFRNAHDLVFDLEGVLEAGVQVPASSRRLSRSVLALLSALVLLMVLAGGVFAGRRWAPADPTGVVESHRLTDFVGLEEFPSISPDLKAVAFTARRNGFRQIFVRRLDGGAPLKLTDGTVDHEFPRWSPDGGSLIYFSPAKPGQAQGAIWRVPVLGGAPRRITDSHGGADVARDGRLAFFRTSNGHVELAISSPDGSDARVLARFTEAIYYKYPRWSPDQRWIAYQSGDGFRWHISIVGVDGQPARQLTRESGQIYGLAWLPGSARLIYSSSRKTTMAYLPPLALWDLPLDGSEPRRAAPLDMSYLYPDVHESGAIVASRLNIHSDLWKYPTTGLPAENVRAAVRVTRQTGQVQTPTAGPEDREIAFLSDTGGHANLWVTTPATGDLRQITHERDESVAMGVPIWSPDGKWIAFVSSRGNTGLDFGLWVVSPDGGNLRNLAPRGLGAAWSSDGAWVYFAEGGQIHKIPAAGGQATQVRAGPARNIIAVHGNSLYFMVDRMLADGTPGFDIHAATPEDAPSRVIASISASRVPQWQIINPTLSPGGEWLAMPLTDGVATNIWTLSTSNGEWRQITDFGDRPTFIARRVSWSSDGKSIFAAVSEGDTDVVVLDRRR